MGDHPSALCTEITQLGANNTENSQLRHGGDTCNIPLLVVILQVGERGAVLVLLFSFCLPLCLCLDGDHS
jgi:hypothetical protein